MLTLETRAIGNVMIFDLAGRLDGGASCRDLQDSVKAALEEGQRNFLVNLDGLQWVNSLGLGHLVAAYVSVRNQGGELKLLGGSDRVLKVLDTCGVTPRIIHVYRSETEALGSFA
jgi:anti-sigma B factor antagonist